MTRRVTVKVGTTLVLLTMVDRLFLARDAFLRTNRRAIAMMFVRLSVCLSVCLGQACIEIAQCTLAQI